MKASEFRDSGDKMRYRGWEMKIRQMKYQLCLKELAYAWTNDVSRQERTGLKQTF